MNLLAEIPIIIPEEEVKAAPLLELQVIDCPNTANFKPFLSHG